MNCVICGKEVTKRKSLAYGDGRACRDHVELEPKPVVAAPAAVAPEVAAAPEAKSIHAYAITMILRCSLQGQNAEDFYSASRLDHGREAEHLLRKKVEELGGAYQTGLKLACLLAYKCRES